MKKLLGIIAVTALAAAAGWNFRQEQNEVELSELALANVEALANWETDPMYPGWDIKNCSNEWVGSLQYGDWNYMCSCAVSGSTYL